MSENIPKPNPGEIVDTRYRFKNGERFVTRPDLPLSSLFKPLTDRILDVLKDNNIVVIGGPSGIGKSELFLGISKPKINVSGITEILEEKGISFLLLNLQSASDTALIERLTTKTVVSGSSAKAEKDKILDQSSFVLIDESVIFYRDPEKIPAVKELLNRGKKIVLVGGGSSSSEEQVSYISTALSNDGVILSPDQKLKMSPNLLTRNQALDLLITKGPYSSEDAEKVVRKFEELEIPTMFRTLWMAPFPTRTFDLDEHLKYFSRSNLSYQLSHIATI